MHEVVSLCLQGQAAAAQVQQARLRHAAAKRAVHKLRSRSRALQATTTQASCPLRTYLLSSARSLTVFMSVARRSVASIKLARRLPVTTKKPRTQGALTCNALQEGSVLEGLQAAQQQARLDLEEFRAQQAELQVRLTSAVRARPAQLLSLQLAELVIFSRKADDGNQSEHGQLTQLGFYSC